MTRLIALTVLIGSLFIIPIQTLGQSGLVSGIVKDQTGGFIPNASVTLKSATGKRTAQTNSNGFFSFENVSPGSYEVLVEQQGFGPESIRVVVDNRPIKPIELKLKIATRQEEITVGDDATHVSTQSDNNLDAVSLNQTALENLPVFDGNYIATISRFLDAGAVGTGGPTLIVDGLQVNSANLPLSAIQEIKINQNPYSPEFLRPGRGRIEIVTKASSSAYHGTLNAVFRDNRFNAREPLASAKPQEQRRIFESSLTGPLGSGKTTSFLFTGTYQSDNSQAIVFADGPSGPIHSNLPQPQREVDLSARIAHQFGKKNTASIKYESLDQYRKNQGVGGFTLPETASNFRNREDTITLTDTTTFTSTLVNEFRILFGKEYQSNRSVQVAPRIIVQDAFTGGGAQADRLQTEYHTSLHDAISWIHGRQSIRMGIDVPDISRRGLEDQTNFQGTFSFSNLQDFFQNRPFSFVQQAGQGKVIFWEKVLAGFILDDIRVRRNFTVSVAARYDRQNYFHDSNNISPRIAFAYSPVHHSNTVIRGGAGFFFDRTGAQPIFDLLRYDGRRLLQYVLIDPGYPNPFANGISVQSAPSSVVRLAPDVRIPYLLQFGIGIERQLWKSTALTITYTGNEAVGLFRSRDVNAPLPPLYAARPDPNFGVIRQIESSGRMESHSLDVSLRGNVTQYFSGLVQYTLGRSYNNTNGISSYPANSYDLSGEWGRSDADQRHRFNLLGTLRPGKLFNLGLSLSLNTGRPYTLTTGHDDYHTGIANARPAGIGRNTLQGPGYSDYDVRWSRDFKVAKARKDVVPTVTASLDAFNVFNHSNFSSFVGNESSPFFGQAVSAQPPRRLQLSTRFNF